MASSAAPSAPYCQLHFSTHHDVHYDPQTRRESKTVSIYFTDNKVTPREQERIPQLVTPAGIVFEVSEEKRRNPNSRFLVAIQTCEGSQTFHKSTILFQSLIDNQMVANGSLTTIRISPSIDEYSVNLFVTPPFSRPPCEMYFGLPIKRKFLGVPEYGHTLLPLPLPIRRLPPHLPPLPPLCFSPDPSVTVPLMVLSGDTERPQPTPSLPQAIQFP